MSICFRALNKLPIILIALTLTIFSFSGSNASELIDKTVTKEKLHQLFEKYLMENPEVILRSIKRMEEQQNKNAELAAQKVLREKRQNIEYDPMSFVSGNSKGDVTIIEFFDYQCGFCKRSHKNIQEIINEDGNIRLVYKEFPILGPTSLYAARAALASKLQGKYFQFHDALMRTSRKLDKNGILDVAKKVGIDQKKLILDIESQQDQATEHLKSVSLLARELNINGTPSFIIKDNILRGAADKQTIIGLINDIRASKD